MVKNSGIPFDIQDEWNSLVSEIRMHNRLYYEEDLPLISDEDYDALYRRLVQLESRFPELINEESPTQKIHVQLQDDAEEVTHLFPLYSLDSVYTFEEVEQFVTRTSKAQEKEKICYVVEGKIDGLTLALHYKKGRLVSAATRGNGKVGENVTKHIVHISNIPFEITFDSIPEDLEIRGEVYIESRDFEAFNQYRYKKGETCFSNPRNAAAGALRHLDPAHTMHRGLKFAVHGVWPQIESSYSNAMKLLKSLGFYMPLSCGFGKTAKELLKYFEEISLERESLDYQIDGLVYKVDDWEHSNHLGYRAKSPRFAIAHKFPAQSSITVLEDIQIQVGRTGILTPVAILSPVLLGGVQITRATLHNEDEILKKDFRIGDRVRIQRAGDVIPQVCEVVYPKYRNNSSEDNGRFVFPSSCPACEGSVIRLKGESAWRCISGLKCPAQKIWSLYHFVSKEGMDIQGLGPQNVRALYQAGILTELVDLFTLSQHKEYWLTLEGWREKSVEGVLRSIEHRRNNISAESFFYALSIPHVGKVTAALLAKNFSPETLITMPKEVLQEILITMQGIGAVLAESIANFFYHNSLQIQKILAYLSFKKNEKIQVFLPLQGKKVVFTGHFQHGTRQNFEKEAERFGAAIGSQVSKNTHYLVVGEKPGSKYARAKELKIQTLTEEEWMAFLQTFLS
ncbi:NAD-dependent DNA ligase LigA [Holospora undulata]|uniref:DNA ligase n=1 Tax=Holospora undulata HU1 TaxID=1321371 RepID=A0A061JGW3_9PROT|nr:NAD-dependent DNA ligase LigA [Holospora undulata]ETZ05391.1 DNA ligase [Holospora undulata HU1]